jgi:hypothetical protein
MILNLKIVIQKLVHLFNIFSIKERLDKHQGRNNCKAPHNKPLEFIVLIPTNHCCTKPYGQCTISFLLNKYPKMIPYSVGPYTKNNIKSQE